MLIDWHAHHTAPEMAARITELTGHAPKPDAFDSPDFSKRIAEMDACGIDFQLVSQGAGLNANQLPAGESLTAAKASNDAIADRIAPYSDRLFGTIAITYTDTDGSAAEIDRMAQRGFRAVMMYARPDLVGKAETEQPFARAAAKGLPVFLHGGGAGGRRDPSLDELEDGGQGVAVSVLADAAVAEFVVKLIAAGVFDRYPELQIVVRSSGGSIPSLLNKLWWKHKTAGGERRYSEVLLEHCLVDCANGDARTLAFLVDVMGENNVVFGSDYCGGLGPLEKAIAVVDEQREPDRVRKLMERNSRRLLRL
ncbi:MAG TPA: amidohydrolase family protein [Chloroflexota bacterium]|nr:amidohydrolase family protein [Chloroflexota bacterium]